NKSKSLRMRSDLVEKIDRDAQIPEGLEAHIKNGCIISFSFSFLNDAYGKIFEPGATPTSKRLIALQEVLSKGFLAGISLMPLLPWISDTTEHLELLFSTFKKSKVKYVLPATTTLYGEGKADSKTLMMRAIRKHFPQLEKRYLKYFADGPEMPVYYRNAFYQKMKDICREYQLHDAILKASRFS
ncbi:MAG: radical SAM protein, partial [Bacteroidota bacterium]